MNVPEETSARPWLCSWYFVLILYLVYVVNSADRQLLGILAQDVKQELRLSDSEIGLLTGPAIALFYSIMGVPMGFVADRIHRVRYIAACLTVWSVMTILSGKAANLAQMAATRIGVSVAEAGSTPSSVSLIADYFPPIRRAIPMAIWTSATSAGVLVSFALGGVLNEAIGWRHTFVVAGVTGLLLTLIVILTIREPVRGAMEPGRWSQSGPLSMWATVRYMSKIRMYRQAVVGSIFCNFCVYAVLAWAAAFAIRKFGVGTDEIGPMIGLGIGIFGSTTLILSGVISDSLLKRGMVWPLLWVVAGLLLAAMFFGLSLFSGNLTAFSILLTLGYCGLLFYPPIVWVIIQSASPPNMRGMATAIYVVSHGLFAAMPGPLIVGVVSDVLQPSMGVRSLQFALLVVPLAAVGGALQFLRVARTAAREEHPSPADGPESSVPAAT